MTTRSNRFSWLSSGLFWRTFFLLAFLITASLTVWVSSLRVVERAPRARQIASQIASIVTVTRAAITNSAPDLRRELLIDLATSEGIMIVPLEDTDQVNPVPASPLLDQIQTELRTKLGRQTRFAGQINEHDGFWVSFDIEGDPYWLGLERERIDRPSGIEWLGWASATLIASLFGAVFISRLINQPLARLTVATRDVAQGKLPEPLPESGPDEVREANRSFNQMVADLNRVESDRALVLAGISHDLRTPLARMQLEVEMAALSDESRLGMQSDLNQMDAIIGQFLDYAKPTDSTTFSLLNLGELLLDSAQAAARGKSGVELHMQTEVHPDLFVRGNATELKRVFANLIENARRYGRTADADFVELDITGHAGDGEVVVGIADHGSGVPDTELERLLRPFTRLDSARSQANGAGLGLAIVERVVKRHGGRLRLRNREGGGLMVEIALPTA